MTHIKYLVGLTIAILSWQTSYVMSQQVGWVSVHSIDGANARGQLTISAYPDKGIQWRKNITGGGCNTSGYCYPCPSVTLSPESGTLLANGSVTVQVIVTPADASPGHQRSFFTLEVKNLDGTHDSYWEYGVDLEVDPLGTWTPQMSNTNTNLVDVCFIDNLRGWAVGFSGPCSELVKTVNGGKTWTNLHPCNPVPYFLYEDFNAVHFLNSSTGWLVGNTFLSGQFPNLRKTVDGGANWSPPITLPSRPNSLPFPERLQDIQFVDDQYGWVVGYKAAILHTIDGGGNWTWQKSGASDDISFNLNAVKFFNRSVGIAVGGTAMRNVILRTVNGGASWSVVLDQPARELANTWKAGLLSISFVDNLVGRVAGSDRNIFSTDDGGATWNGPNIPVYPLVHNSSPVNDGCEIKDFTSLAFTASNSGWGAIGGQLLKSNTAGLTWGGGGTGINAVAFVDAQNGWAVGINGTILRYFVSPTSLTNTGFENGTNGWTSYSGVASGINFTTASGGPTGSYARVHINRTSNNMQFYQTYFRLTAGKRYTLSFDAYSPTSRQVHVSVMKHSSNPAQYFGVNPYVQLTAGWRHYEYPFTAGGFSGTTNDTRLRFYFVYLCQAGDDYYFDNIELKQVLPKEGEQEVVALPTSYVLEQNYPNPFNPTTNIRFSLPNDGHVTLKVFDVLGREVKLLVNEVRVAGSYTETLDATGLASGMYFYRLESGSFAQTMKMIVVK